MSTLDSVLAQYEKNKQSTSGNKISNEDRLKKYFTTVLPKGTKTLEKRIRILPTKDDTTPFVQQRFHELQVDGKWVKLWDPAQENKRSPLNEVAEGLKMNGDEESKNLAKNYYSRTYYIVKLIDRDNEQDGPKFWRFKHSAKGDGVLDKIIPIWKNKGDITNPEKGRDLILTLSLTKSNNGKEYTVVSSVIPEDSGPLSADAEQSASWLANEEVWSDVYSKRGEDYLEIVAQGETPKWDNNNKKWISTATAESTGEVNIGENVPALSSDPQEEEASSDDLPF